MKILILTLNAWSVTNSTGNTITNLFSELSDIDEIANIYCRNEAIDNPICHHYFKVTESDILHNIFSSNKCGNELTLCNEKRTFGTNVLSKGKRGDYLRKHRFTSLLVLRELIWLFPVWKNDKLKKFVLDFAPDIIYMHGHNNLYMHRLLDYCRKLTGAKVAMYWGDDMYGRKSSAPLGYLYETLLRSHYRKSIKLSSLLFGGSLKLCNEYSAIFSKQFVPFFKECKQVHYDKNKTIGNPITIVYAGNLLFGREQMMIKFVNALKRVNAKSLARQYRLKIFSNTNPTVESLAVLDDKTNCCFMGCKPYEEVCKEMDKSDLVLFLESFDRKSIQITRLSFSTKIIDCMQSSAGILAIGPLEIASMDYLAKNNLGYIISDIEKMDEKLEYLVNHAEIIQEQNEHKVDFAKEYHTNTSQKALNELRKIV
jgi:hypothetical protein